MNLPPGIIVNCHIPLTIPLVLTLHMPPEDGDCSCWMLGSSATSTTQDVLMLLIIGLGTDSSIVWKRVRTIGLSPQSTPMSNTDFLALNFFHFQLPFSG